MNRAEYIEQCRLLTEDELAAKAQALRERSNSRVPPEVQAQFRLLDGVTQADETWVDTAWGRTHIFLVSRWKEAAGKRPVLINVHGGGFCLEHTERDIYFSRRMANRTGCLVVDVDYVLAPEHPYPAAIEELEALLDALPALAERWGGDPERVILCGQSAGGNLLAAVTQRGRYTDRIKPLRQILCYMPADNYNDRFCGGELDGRAMDTELYGFLYIRNFDERKNTDASMVLSSPEDVKHLPPTDIITAGLDNLRPEAERYLQILKAAGVQTTYRCFEQSNHGFLVNLNGEYLACEDYVTELILDVL